MKLKIIKKQASAFIQICYKGTIDKKIMNTFNTVSTLLKLIRNNIFNLK